jgi:hypothetical protein
MPEQIFIKFGMYIMAPEPISTAYFVNPSHHSICIYMYHIFVPRQRLVKKVTVAKNIHTSLSVAVRIVSKERRLLVLPRTYCFLCNLSSLSIATRLRTGEASFDFQQEQRFFCSLPSLDRLWDRPLLLTPFPR